MSIELRQLRHALALYKHGNFARAADDVHLTQPSLSRSIAQLESSLGVPLFDRSTRRVRPTAFGQLLLRQGEQLLQSAQALVRELELLKDLECGQVSIVAGPYAGETLVADAIARLINRYPALKVQLKIVSTEEIQSMVLKGAADIGVVTTCALQADEDLQTQVLKPMRLYMACRPQHPLTQELAPSLEQVFKFPVATTTLTGRYADVARAAASQSSRPRDICFTPAIEIHSLAIAKRVVQNSDAVVPLPAIALVDEVASGRLAVLNVQEPALYNDVAIINKRSHSLSPAATALVDIIQEAEMQEQEAAEQRLAELTGMAHVAVHTLA